MIKARMIPLGARIPADLKKKVSSYCDRKGVKLQFFITQAIAEKLSDIDEDEFDKKILEERLKNSQLTSIAQLSKYVKSREK